MYAIKKLATGELLVVVVNQVPRWIFVAPEIIKERGGAPARWNIDGASNFVHQDAQLSAMYMRNEIDIIEDNEKWID